MGTRLNKTVALFVIPGKSLFVKYEDIKKLNNSYNRIFHRPLDAKISIDRQNHNEWIL